MYCLPILKPLTLDPQDPTYIERLKIELIKKSGAIALWVLGILCVSYVCIYVVSRSNFRILANVMSFGGCVFLAAHVIQNYLQWKKSQKALSQINKPKQKFFEIDGFIKVTKNVRLSPAELKTEAITSNSSVSLTHVTKDMLRCIFVWLNPSDLSRVSQCCKLFRETLNEADFFKQLIKKDFELDLPEGNLKEEYRRRISWRKCIYTRYRCLIDHFSNYLFFQNRLLLVKDRSIEMTNGTKIAQISNPKHCRLTNSLIYIIRRPFLDVFNGEGKLVNSIELSRWTGIWLDFIGYKGMHCISLPEKEIVAANNNIFILDKNGKLLEQKELGDLTIKGATWTNGQLVVLVRDEMTPFDSILFYSIMPTLKEENKIDKTKVTFVDTLYDAEKKQEYLRVSQRNTVSLYSSNKLDNPLSSFDIPRKAKRSGARPGQKYVWYYMGTEIQIYDLLKKSYYKIDCTLENWNFSIIEYKNFLICSTDIEIFILDLTLSERVITLMKRSTGTICRVEVMQGKLLVNMHYGYQKAGIEVFDFGNFG